MEAVNTQVVQRSNYLIDYGKENFAYQESMCFSSLFTALLAYIFLALFLALSSIKWTRENIVKRLVPKPGEGPSEAARKTAFFTYHYIAEVS